MSEDQAELRTLIEKAPLLPKIWTSEVLKEYLLSQSKGQEFLLPLEEFPEEIELSHDWHEVLNTMRQGTNHDGIERVALVGFNSSHRAIYLPNFKMAAGVLDKSSGVITDYGEGQAVNPTLIELQRIFASKKGIEGFSGLLHSHPPDSSLFSPIFDLFGEHRLSAGDLYIALKGYYGNLMGVADGPINSFAFKTKESIIPRDDHETFYRLWEQEPRIRNLDQVIAQKYKLALYRGNKNQSLKRVSLKK